MLNLRGTNKEDIMAAGERRGGKPRSEAERKARHEKIYGKASPLPPRGTGLGCGIGRGGNNTRVR